MTLTKFDRWLMETFVYEHQIKVVSLPERLPKTVKVSELHSQNYNYIITAKNSKVAEKLIAQLTHSGSIFSTKTVEGSHWYNSLIATKNNSLSFRIFWLAVLLTLGSFLFFNIKTFLQSDLYFEIKGHIESVINQELLN